MHCQRKEKELKSEISEDTTDLSCVEMNCYLKIFLKNNIKNTRQDSSVKKSVLSILVEIRGLRLMIIIEF